jgi:hypothetical protein
MRETETETEHIKRRREKERERKTERRGWKTKKPVAGDRAMRVPAVTLHFFGEKK